MVVKSNRKNREDRAQTSEPAKGIYPFRNRKVWEDAAGISQVDEDEDEEKEKAEWLEAESKVESEAPRDCYGGSNIPRTSEYTRPGRW